MNIVFNRIRLDIMMNSIGKGAKECSRVIGGRMKFSARFPTDFTVN